jgi:hypothetical protein
VSTRKWFLPKGFSGRLLSVVVLSDISLGFRGSPIREASGVYRDRSILCYKIYAFFSTGDVNLFLILLSTQITYTELLRYRKWSDLPLGLDNSRRIL